MARFTSTDVDTPITVCMR